MVSAMTGAGAILVDLCQFLGFQLTYGISDRTIDTTIHLDSGRPQTHHSTHADPSNYDRIRPRSRKGFHGTACAMDMTLVAIAYRLNGHRFRIYECEDRSGSEMAVHRALKSQVFTNGNSDLHASTFPFSTSLLVLATGLTAVGTSQQAIPRRRRP